MYMAHEQALDPAESTQYAQRMSASRETSQSAASLLGRSAAVAVREVSASWCLDTRAPNVDEEKWFLRSSRRVVGEWCAYLGADPDAVDDAVLAASELVTNAIRHGCAPYELHLHEVPDGLRWSVIDSGCGHSVIKSVLVGTHRTGSALQGEVGRGLVLVVRLFPGCEAHAAANAYGEPATAVSFTVPRAVSMRVA